MASINRTSPHNGRRWIKDTQDMFEVRYVDGRSAYIRVDPKAGEYGTAPVLGIAKARQATGEIPDGEIVRVQKVK
jgi:hypothetical protein